MLTEAILEMVKARLGVSVMQTWTVEPAIRAGHVKAIPITPSGIDCRVTNNVTSALHAIYRNVIYTR
jgi:DNA-binding transcriptional LysR family regulator